MGEYNKKRIKKIFGVIKRNTNYCAACGCKYDMNNSGHSHFPFCEKCRGVIIKKEMYTIEKVPKIK